MMNCPRPEHPNPQFERKDWVNLNGIWDFEFDFSDSGLERDFASRTELDQKIVVPFCPESRLSGIGFRDFIPAVWYHRTFSVEKEKLDGCIWLHFGAVDYECRVFVNGREAGRHQGGYASFALQISDLVHEGENHLTVFARDDTRSLLQPSGKQSDRHASYGCFYTRTTGIWQTVWLEFTPSACLRQVRYYPDIAQKKLVIQAEVQGSGTLSAVAAYQGNECGRAEAFSHGGSVFLSLELSELHLWEPGAGRLYDLTLTYGEDQVSSYFGMRDLRLDGFRFLINGKSVFQRLVLDQGFYSDGIYTAPQDEALRRDIELAMEAGFNGARLHQKVFEPRFLYHCDRMGYLVWGEMASWGLDISSSASYAAFLPEWAQVVQRDFNHPAIIGWCPFNETWDVQGRRQLDELIAHTWQLTRTLDPTRPCIDTSGNYHVQTDIFDLHDYQQDPEVFAASYRDFANGTGPFADPYADRQHYRESMPVMISEYGGIRWSVHDDNRQAWGYGEAPKTEAEFIARYTALTETLLSNPRFFGFCYTQLTDVEQEQNGLYTDQREAKMDPAIFRAVNSQKAAIED